jgi:DNA gyrase/topoisomerase IV subunit A
MPEMTATLQGRIKRVVTKEGPEETLVTEIVIQILQKDGYALDDLVGLRSDITITPKQQVMLISAEGMMTRTPVKEEDPRKGITTQGRSTQGVRVMTLDEGDKLVAITTFEESKDD